MSSTTGDSEPAGAAEGRRLLKNLTPPLLIILVVAISVGLYLWARDPATVVRLKSYGYSGAFLISLVGNASVLLPAVVLPMLCGLGVMLYPTDGLAGPVMVGLLGGVGAAIGETVGYIAGYGGRRIVENNRLYETLSRWVRQWGAFAIFVLAAVPLIFDLVGLAAGALRFPLWKFLLFCWLGRSLLYITFVVATALGWRTVLSHFG